MRTTPLLFTALGCVIAASSATQLMHRSPERARFGAASWRQPGGPILRLRGGVQELRDVEEWETLLAGSGSSLIVLDFTATWCGPCQRIAPAFAAMAAEMPDVIFRKVRASRREPASSRPHARSSRARWQVDVDDLGELAAELGVTSMPTFLLFRDGEKIASLRGADEGALRSLVEEHAAAVPA